MESRRLRFPRINLASHDAIELSVLGSYSPEGRDKVPIEAADQIPEASGHFYPSFTAYIARDAERTKHSLAGLIFIPDDHTRDLRVSVSYVLGEEPGRGGPRRVHRESEFLSLLRSLGPAKSLSVSVEFRFRGEEAQRLVIPLPFKVEGGEGLAKQAEIRGLRVVIPTVADAGLPELSMIIDRPLGEDVLLDIRFELPGHTLPVEEVPQGWRGALFGYPREGT
jgi:hypothetical protein